jgi:excisionase family DNA binding protein
MPYMLSPEQAAEALGVSRKTIYQWIGQRKVDSVKISSRCVRIPIASIERMIADNTVPAL